MGFFNYTKAKRFYENDAFMLEIIDRLQEIDQYHLLRDSEDLQHIPEIIQKLSTEYKKWLSVCDGGLLFSTTLLSLEEYDKQLDLSFSTVQASNSKKEKNLFRLPKGYVIIAILNYGDPVCLSENDSKIYLWDTQEESFTTVWESFADFLADEYNTAIQMIEDNALMPVPLKNQEK